MARFIDTNILVACLRGRAPQVQERFFQHDPAGIKVPFQVLAELKLGAAKSARPEHHARQVRVILSPFEVVWPDAIAVEHYVEIRAALEKSGTAIGEADLWIAAITRAAKGTLVTDNTDEFSRVSGLPLENWLTLGP